MGGISWHACYSNESARNLKIINQNKYQKKPSISFAKYNIKHYIPFKMNRFFSREGYRIVQFGTFIGGTVLAAVYLPLFYNKYLKGDIPAGASTETRIPTTAIETVQDQIKRQSNSDPADNKKMKHYAEIGNSHEDKVAGWETKPEVHRLLSNKQDTHKDVARS